ncbi:MAG: secretin and TonB N-terminal domain-containing protein, partial [Duganella sp.]
MFKHKLPASLPLPLSLAPISLAILTLLSALPAQAQSTPNAASPTASVPAPKSYQLSGGTLTSVLGRFAAASGVALSFDPVMTDGRNSSGLQGDHTVAAGFALLLAGSGLEAVGSADGGYVLRKAGSNTAAQEPVSVLPQVNVQVQGLDNLSEGSGAYTIGASSTATKLSMSLRDTPQ